MPVIFASSSKNQREQGYADVLDESYEFPRAYANRVLEGDVFLYYRGTKTSEPSGYFGTGVIGAITDSTQSNRLRCAVLNVEFFTAPVPLRDPQSAAYFEDPGPNQVNFQQGVRTVSQGVLRRILELGDAETPSTSGAEVGGASVGSGYSSDVAKREATELFAVDTVEKLLRQEFPDAVITVQPRNNPGFDILVVGAPLQFVEVKGTIGPAVEFFLTEGERKFGQAHAGDYRLYVVYGIDLATGANEIFRHDGAVHTGTFQLDPRQYRVCLASEIGA